jgi:hypothetical protein
MLSVRNSTHRRYALDGAMTNERERDASPGPSHVRVTVHSRPGAHNKADQLPCMWHPCLTSLRRLWHPSTALVVMPTSIALLLSQPSICFYHGSYYMTATATARKIGQRATRCIQRSAAGECSQLDATQHMKQQLTSPVIWLGRYVLSMSSRVHAPPRPKSLR